MQPLRADLEKRYAWYSNKTYKRYIWTSSFLVKLHPFWIWMEMSTFVVFAAYHVCTDGIKEPWRKSTSFEFLNSKEWRPWKNFVADKAYRTVCGEVLHAWCIVEKYFLHIFLIYMTSSILLSFLQYHTKRQKHFKELPISKIPSLYVLRGRVAMGEIPYKLNLCF